MADNPITFFAIGTSATFVTLAWYFQSELNQHFCAASYTIMIATKLVDTKLESFEAYV